MRSLHRELAAVARELLEALDALTQSELEAMQDSACEALAGAAGIVREADLPLSSADRRRIMGMLIEGAAAGAARNPIMHERVWRAAEALRSVLARMDQGAGAEANGQGNESSR